MHSLRETSREPEITLHLDRLDLYTMILSILYMRRINYYNRHVTIPNFIMFQFLKNPSSSQANTREIKYKHRFYSWYNDKKDWRCRWLAHIFPSRPQTGQKKKLQSLCIVIEQKLIYSVIQPTNCNSHLPKKKTRILIKKKDTVWTTKIW